MNRRQRERVADLGRAFQDAVESIINLEESILVEEPALEAYDREEVCREQPIPIESDGMEEPMPMPVDLNDKLAQYDVTIKHVHNGFIVNVGCQTFVFESFDKLAKYMAIYYNDPRGTYEKHYKGELISK
jgi:hypothetical protein